MDAAEKAPTVGLVIQGPLRSPGKTGRSFRVEKRRAIADDDVCNFDCVPGLNAMVEEHGALFDRIVVSTWRGQAIDSLHPSVEVVMANDDTPDVQRSGGATIGLISNKLRGYDSAHRGLVALDGPDAPDIVIRMRTDQTMNLAALTDFLCARFLSDEGFGKRIYVPLVFLDRLGEFSDFFFAGSFAAILTMYRRFLDREYAECHASVHADIPLKLALQSFGGKASLAHFPLRTAIGGMPRVSRSLYSALYSSVVEPVPREVFESVKWRGEAMNPGGYLPETSCFYAEWVGQGRGNVLSAIDDVVDTPLQFASVNLSYWLGYRLPPLRRARIGRRLLDVLDRFARAAGAAEQVMTNRVVLKRGQHNVR